MNFKIKKSTIIYGFLLLLYYRPASYIIGTTADNFCLAVVCVLSVCFFIKAVLEYKNGIYHPSATSICLILFFGWCMIGSTCLNYFISRNVSFNYAITTFCCELGIIIISDMQLEKNSEHYIQLFVSIGGFFSLINAITMFIYGYSGGLNSITERDGRTISSYYFYFAEDNATFFLVWPVMVLTWIFYFKYKRSKKMLLWSIFFTAITTASYVYMWSVNNMIGCFITIGLIVFYWRKLLKGKNSVKKNHIIAKFDIGWILMMIYNYLLVIAQIFLKYSDFIVNTLHKSLTLGGRLPIWQRCLVYVREQPLIGFGYESRSVTISKIIFNHAHNIMLEILYRGGIIGMTLFIITMIVTGKKVKKYQDNAIIMFLGWCVVLFIFLSSIEFAFYRYPYIIMFVLLGRCNVLCERENIK